MGVHSAHDPMLWACGVCALCRFFSRSTTTFQSSSLFCLHINSSVRACLCVCVCLCSQVLNKLTTTFFQIKNTKHNTYEIHSNAISTPKWPQESYPAPDAPRAPHCAETGHFHWLLPMPSCELWARTRVLCAPWPHKFQRAASGSL